MSTELDRRLKRAVADRDKLAEQAQRIAGRKEAADQALESLEQEIRAKNLDPDTLDETVLKFEAALVSEIENIEAGVEKARTDLNPYLELP
tara:strand:- start:368 stop:640 length:273 start_codon:yes stop_codon:yes gene_type:complete